VALDDRLDDVSAARARRAIGPLAVIVAIVVLPFALLLISTWIQGNRLQVVESGSMEPTYPVGSALVVASVRPGAVEVGDALVFADAERNGALVTHRVIDIEDRRGELAFQTKGDANATADATWVEAPAVRGVVERSVPGLGRFLHLLQWPTSALVLVGLPLALLVADAVLDRRPGTIEAARVSPSGS
jgi:signal peptidase